MKTIPIKKLVFYDDRYIATDGSKRKFMTYGYEDIEWIETCGKCWEPCCPVDPNKIKLVVIK